MKELILLVAHGSSDSNWSDTFVTLTKPACEASNNVKLAFMELSSPSIQEVVEEAAADGYECIRALPLFLAKGKHLKHDIPNILADLEQKLGIETELLPPIGEHPELAQSILKIIEVTQH